MKIRMRSNSIRLRLLRAEVDALARGEPIAETVVFGPGPTQRFAYALAADPNTDAVHATFSGNVVEVRVPAVLAREWAISEVAGIERAQANGDENPLQILIEKDFTCLLPRTGEAEGDTFANPNARRVEAD